VPCRRHQRLGCGLADLEIYFFIFSFTKTLQVWRDPQRSRWHWPLGCRPAKVEKEFQENKKEIIIIFSFLFYFIKLFFKHFQFGGPATKPPEPTAWLWVCQTWNFFQQLYIFFLKFFLKHFNFSRAATTLCLQARQTWKKIRKKEKEKTFFFFFS
jgi:hypothetical protein